MCTAGVLSDHHCVFWLSQPHAAQVLSVLCISRCCGDVGCAQSSVQYADGVRTLVMSRYTLYICSAIMHILNLDNKFITKYTILFPFVDLNQSSHYFT